MGKQRFPGQVKPNTRVTDFWVGMVVRAGDRYLRVTSVKTFVVHAQFRMGASGRFSKDSKPFDKKVLQRVYSLVP